MAIYWQRAVPPSLDSNDVDVGDRLSILLHAMIRMRDVKREREREILCDEFDGSGKRAQSMIMNHELCMRFYGLM